MRRATVHRPSDFSQSNGVRICSTSGCSGRSRRSLNAAGADAAGGKGVGARMIESEGGREEGREGKGVRCGEGSGGAAGGDGDSEVEGVTQSKRE